MTKEEMEASSVAFIRDEVERCGEFTYTSHKKEHIYLTVSFEGRLRNVSEEVILEIVASAYAGIYKLFVKLPSIAPLAISSKIDTSIEETIKKVEDAIEERGVPVGNFEGWPRMRGA
jgi:hypothetical protein